DKEGLRTTIAAILEVDIKPRARSSGIVGGYRLKRHHPRAAIPVGLRQDYPVAKLIRRF
ncbi:unnamed protein product, partial [marine sediment metagenome]